MRRRGLTLIEVLVIVLILGVLVALLLPSVRTAGLAARRSQCVNNLKMIGLAASNYGSAHGVLPPTSGSGPDTASMKARLLPYLESAGLYGSLNLALPHDDPANGTVRSTVVNVFLCPSDLPPARSAGTGPAPGHYLNAIGTYAGNRGGKLDGPAWIAGDPLNGTPIRPGDVTDGLATTLLFAETRLGVDKGWTDDSTRIRWSTDRDRDPGPRPLAKLAAGCSASSEFASDRKGHDWLDSACGKGGGYSHVLTPNAASCLFPDLGFRADRTLVSAGSNHPGGVNALRLDGSVAFVSTTIGPDVWWALGTASGGEPVHGDSY